MKKSVFVFLVAAAAASLAPGCASAPQGGAPYSYTGEKTLYPAVYYAILNGVPRYWKDCAPEIQDNGNTVVIREVHAPDLLNEAVFTLTVRLTDGVVQYGFSNIIEHPVTDASSRREVNDISQPGVKAGITNYLTEQIAKVMEDDTLYNETKLEVDKNTGGPAYIRLRIVRKTPNML
jgi:hypothetical protein